MIDNPEPTKINEQSRKIARRRPPVIKGPPNKLPISMPSNPALPISVPYSFI